nr:hypothetical protein Iba_chr12bCG20510 [Ipomoea batatas]
MDSSSTTAHSRHRTAAHLRRRTAAPPHLFHWNKHLGFLPRDRSLRLRLCLATTPLSTSHQLPGLLIHPQPASVAGHVASTVYLVLKLEEIGEVAQLWTYIKVNQLEVSCQVIVIR